jgi:hypothetical protein
MSKIEIINRALLKLGEPPIASLNDAAFGKSFDMVYQDVKNLLLSTYPWRFAVITQTLPKREQKYGARYMYTIPADCLFLIKVFASSEQDMADVRFRAAVDYELADGAIVSDVAQGLHIEYVRRLDDDATFPPLFREALAAKTAAELSMRVKHDFNLKQLFETEFFNLIRQAELNNEIMKSAEILPDDSWVKIRQFF